MPVLIKVQDLFDMFPGTHCYWNNQSLFFVFQYNNSEICLHSTANIAPQFYYDDNGNYVPEERSISNEIYWDLKDQSIIKEMDFLVNHDVYYIVCKLYNVDEKIWNRVLRKARKAGIKHKKGFCINRKE